jgi:hypothetical protein
VDACCTSRGGFRNEGRGQPRKGRDAEMEKNNAKSLKFILINQDFCVLKGQ